MQNMPPFGHITPTGPIKGGGSDVTSWRGKKRSNSHGQSNSGARKAKKKRKTNNVAVDSPTAVVVEEVVNGTRVFSTGPGPPPMNGDPPSYKGSQFVK